MYRGKKIAELSKETNKTKENKPTTRLRFQDFNNAESNVVDFQNKSWCPEGSVHQYQDEDDSDILSDSDGSVDLFQPFLGEE